MPRWPRIAIRAFAIANIIFGLLGLISMSEYPLYHRYYIRMLSERPYLAQSFYVLAGLDFVCLVVLLLSSLFLWRLRQSGRLISNILFTFELLELMIPPALSVKLVEDGGNSAVIGDSIARATGIAGGGMMPQMIVGYPIIALIFLNIAYHCLNQQAITRAAK